MAYIPDLTPCKYLDRDGSLGLVAVGWLAKGKPYAQGVVMPGVRRRLTELLAHTFCPVVLLGPHTCDICKSAQGTRNLVIPARDAIYACPELIEHYIDHHGYNPPALFRAAMESCPDVGSEEYFLRILECGGADWVGALPTPLGPFDEAEEERTTIWAGPPRTAAERMAYLRSIHDRLDTDARNAQRAIQRWRSPVARLRRWFGAR